MLRRNLARATKDLGYRLRFPLFDFACLWYLHKKDQLREDKIKELFPSDALDLINETVDLIKLRSLGDLQTTLSQRQEALASYREAIEAYSYVLSLAPDNNYAHNNKGLTLIELGNLLTNSSQTDAISCYQQALAHFSRFLELAPGDNYIRQKRDSLAEFLWGLE